MTRRRVAAALLALGAVAGLAAPQAQGKPLPGQVSVLVRAVGGISVAGDGSRTSTLALSPALVSLKRLDRLGWKDRDTITEPHLFVFTTDSTQVLGRTIDDGRPCSLCATAVAEMSAVLAVTPTATRVEHGQTGGLDVTGDAYLDRLDDDVWVRVLAPSGTVFYYLDAYHPWEHGEVHITG